MRIPALTILLAIAVAHAEPNAGQLMKQARRAERSGNLVQAYLLYSQAAAKNPQNREAWVRSLALRTRAATQAAVMPDLSGAEASIPPGSGEKLPTLALDPVSPEDLDAARQPLPPIRLQADAQKRDIHLRGDARQLWEKMFAFFGLQVIFEADYQALQNLRLELDGAAFEEALYALETATASFAVPVSERLALVARDTPQKRQELEHTMAATIPIPIPVSIQEAQELARSVQQLMEIQKFGIDSQRRLLVVRDRVAKVRPAVAILQDLLQHRPEVSIEVEFLEVIENSSLSYGLRLPGSFPLVWFSDILNSKPFVPSGFTRFLSFGAGASFLGLGVADAELFASMSHGSSRNLMRAVLRSLDGQPAEFHLGDKYPILTTGYFGSVDPGGGDVYTPPPTFNFEDLGVVMKLTPKVHSEDEITLTVEAEFKVLTGDSLNGIPVIANRKFASQVRVREGEWALVAGLMRSTEARTVTGIAGLSQLPALGPLFRQNQKDRDGGQTLLVIKPRLLSPPLSEVATHELWTGSEARPRSPL